MIVAPRPAISPKFLLARGPAIARKGTHLVAKIHALLSFLQDVHLADSYQMEITFSQI